MLRGRTWPSVAISGLLMVLAISQSKAATRVYLMRGLFDASTGLDVLAAKLRRHGISATTAGYSAKSEFAAAAIRGYKSGSTCPVVIVGHSLGADAAVTMADELDSAGVPVALLVAYSPASSRAIPRNVARVVNYYQSNSVFNNTYTRGPGFHGSLRNVNLARSDNIDHFNIEKVSRLHAEAMRLIEGIRDSCAHREH